MEFTPTFWLSAFGVFFTIIGSVWALALWLSGKFEKLQINFGDKLELMQKTIMEKFEHHERYDDKRFFEVQRDLWSLKVDVAALNGKRCEPSSDLFSGNH